MATSPNVNNYTLGKGVLYFNRMLSDSSYEGERDLGNAPNFSLGFTVDQLDHLSSRSGISRKDKIVSKSVVGNIKFTLDEVNTENLNLYYFGSSAATSAQTASYLQTNVLSVAGGDSITAGTMYDTGYRRIGMWTIRVVYEAGKSASDFPNGAKLSNVSGASPTNYWTAEYATGTLVYLNAKTASGLTTAAGDIYVGVTKIATYTVAPAFDVTKALVKSGATYYQASAVQFSVSTTDGRIMWGSAPSVADGDSVLFAYPAIEAGTVIAALSSSNIEGILRFVSDNPVGDNRMVTVWRVYLKPDSEVSYIGDDWSKMDFTGEVLDDTANHPSNPYFIIETL